MTAKETRMIAIRTLAASLVVAALIHQGLAPADALAGPATCLLDARSAPKTPFLFKGIVRGPATATEVSEQTQIAIRRTRASESPAYAKMPRVFVYYTYNGVRHGTIAAVTDGVMPKAGDQVTLASRHRDPNEPCAFVPWTVVREKGKKPTT
jgi:hypothetical protein